MVRHKLYNRSPAFITAVVHMVHKLAVEVKASFPDIEVYISSLLPRVTSRSMTPRQAVQYNRLAKRFGQNIKSGQTTLGFSYVAVLNRRFWLRISLAEPNAALFAPDGLHATNAGRDVLAMSWLDALTTG
jgi:hypothetical protein